MSEVEKITSFIKSTLAEEHFSNVIIAASGGIDSTVSLYLLAKAVSPENIFVVHLPYKDTFFPSIKKASEALGIPNNNILDISIKSIVDQSAGQLQVSKNDQVRLGNIMARIRMVILYDLAKKHKALVCGTENKSEYYLGYFTRFGDEASDFEPIRHLFKTQVYMLAKELGVPKKFIERSPTAGLWQGQTDEGEFGFAYKEADSVLSLYFEKKLSLAEITKKGFPNAKKITAWCKKNSYKHHTPHVIK